MSDVLKNFGSAVFGEKTMARSLPNETYKKLRYIIKNKTHLDPDIAFVVANAMKEWATSNGATHFAHWFAPLTGTTAQKHDSFITKNECGSPILEFSEKELIKGEPDASSFPSGGLRTTFEARGYTAWDPTSYAFIKDHTLYIPSVFYSYSGEVLDKKTPLLKSMNAIDKQAKRILKLFGEENIKSVETTVGPEQEYFLIDKELYSKRKDLVLCGRTLFGKVPAKAQQLDDHYFTSIKPKVVKFMDDLNKKLWKLGIEAKTEHNEVAPSQHEIAVNFSSSNIASDNNQLLMETMKTTADKHGLVCLFHEKPFDGINGSGKHNNWSISTNTGVNLLEPGNSPHENAKFLLFLAAVIKGVDEYQDLLRATVASSSNDHRLGSNEAPPAIVSIFLGDELMSILSAIESKDSYEAQKKEYITFDIASLPKIKKDSTDRNRTSPFAFTGNKFELRMLGSSASISDINTILNTITANSLKIFADVLENSNDFYEDLMSLISSTIKTHKRIIFQGNNYSKQWEDEANSRGLLNLKTTADALPFLTKEKNIELFKTHGVYKKNEIVSKYNVEMKNYCSYIEIEARVMLEIVSTEIVPAILEYQKDILKTISLKKFSSKEFNCCLEEEVLKKISSFSKDLLICIKELEKIILYSEKPNRLEERTRYYERYVLKSMTELRLVVDELESVVSKKYWPCPTYFDLLFSV